jgi:hypothetical protein
MTQHELDRLADDWIRYHHATKGSPEREESAWTTDLYELEYHDPETLWLLILAIHARDQSARIQEVLSAGPVEDLLAKHGERFIERVESKARQDPICKAAWRSLEKYNERRDLAASPSCLGPTGLGRNS